MGTDLLDFAPNLKMIGRLSLRQEAQQKGILLNTQQYEQLKAIGKGTCAAVFGEPCKSI